MDALETLVEPNRSMGLTGGAERLLWLSEDDEVDQTLAGLHQVLVGAMRVGGGRVPSRCWRPVGVPSVSVARRAPRPSRRSEEEGLSHSHSQRANRGDRREFTECKRPTRLRPLWPRPQITETLANALRAFHRCKDPAKFYTLGLLSRKRSGARPQTLRTCRFRIVVPTVHEKTMLAAQLGDLVDGWSDWLQAGRVSITTVREEPRLIAEGSCCPSILLGFRTSETRHLDVYPCVPNPM